MIATSARAPQTSLQDTEGDPLSLADHVGKDNVLVCFMRTVTCPPCNAKVFGAMQQSGSMLVDREGTVVHAHAATIPVRAHDRASTPPWWACVPEAAPLGRGCGPSCPGG